MPRVYQVKAWIWFLPGKPCLKHFQAPFHAGPRISSESWNSEIKVSDSWHPGCTAWQEFKSCLQTAQGWVLPDGNKQTSLARDFHIRFRAPGGSRSAGSRQGKADLGGPEYVLPHPCSDWVLCRPLRALSCHLEKECWMRASLRASLVQLLP